MALLSGCSGTSLLNTLNNAGGYRTQTDVAYGEHSRQTLDVYQPAKAAKACLIVFVYGGSWEEGHKEDYGFVGAALARLGYTVVIPDYRLYPEVTYPAFVNDIAQALASKPVQQLQRDHKLIMMGHSAGAMLAGQVSYNPQYLAAVGLPKSIIEGYIALAGPHDYFLPTDKPRWVRIFGEDKKAQVDALTVNHIHPDNPPTLILHGAADETVTPKSALSLEQKLTAVGVPVTRKTYQGVGHVRLLAATGRPLGFLAPTLEDIQEFLTKRCQ